MSNWNDDDDGAEYARRLEERVSVVRRESAPPKAVSITIDADPDAFFQDGMRLTTGRGDVFELLVRPRWWELWRLHRLWVWLLAPIKVQAGGRRMRARLVRPAPPLRWTDGGV